MDWQTLNQLVDSWHEAAAQIDGYQDTTRDGGSPWLSLTIRRTADGDLELSVMSVKDRISTIAPQDMLQPGSDPNEPLPYASVTYSQEP